MKKFVFTPFDIVAPWLICLASAGLCTWGAVVAHGPGRWVSTATGLVFLLGILAFYLVRGRKRMPDFEVCGLGIVWGARNKPSKELVALWVRDLTTFWLGKSITLSHAELSARTITQSIVDKALTGMTVICYDADHFSFWGRQVCGYTFGRDVAIGFKGEDMNYTASLFRHEVSHQILDAAGVLWDEARHHRIFQDVGLGA